MSGAERTSGDFEPVLPRTITDEAALPRRFELLAEDVRTTLDRFGARLELICERFLAAVDNLADRMTVAERRDDSHERRLEDHARELAELRERVAALELERKGEP